LASAGVAAAIALAAALPFPARADLNAWTKTTSGNWEEPFWSLGSRPINGQYVAITNEGSKTVAIQSTTTLNYPSNLTVYALTISSPSNSKNALLMNYAGLQVPLAARLLTVDSNSSMALLNSWLDLNGGNGEGLSVGGEFNQDLSSLVTGQQLDVGWIGPGTYNLKSGTLALNVMWLGGPYNGQFNQYAGSCRIGLLHLSGAYNFYGGDEVPTNIYWIDGTFFIRGGIYPLPIRPGNYVQTGGTNYGPIIFDFGTYGTYTHSNGVSFLSDLNLGAWGHYRQWDGTLSVTGQVTASYELGGFRSPAWVGSLILNGGLLSEDGMYLTGNYTQNGGTNRVRGEVTLDGGLSNLQLNGGLLADHDVTVNPSYNSYELTQCGGVHIINDQLTVNGAAGSWALHGVSLCPGAQMVVSNITILTTGALNVAADTITQSGLLRSSTGLIFLGQGTHQFGAFQLDSGQSALTLPLNTNCMVRFRDSSTQAWPGTLIISNWSGSINGGGPHQIIFGNTSSALKLPQLSQIVFQDPQGKTPGLYPAKILSNGEIVPSERASITLAAQASHTMVIDVTNQSGFSYWIETSTNLNSWSLWTNSIVSNGVMSGLDAEITNAPHKFYRAVLRP
jgi:hypothetical protein